MYGILIFLLRAFFKKTLSTLFFLLLFLSIFAFSATAENNTFVVLCYHDIPKEVNLNDYSVDQVSFVQQIEYLQNHGYRFISLDDIIKASNNNSSLPEKSVLLTFDDAYLSFYEFVYPILKLYNYPCVLAVVTSWIDKPPANLKEKLMNWQQIKEVSKSNLVKIASHTNNLHRAVIYNPQGNDSWAAVTRIYNMSSKKYETEDEFITRISEDLNLSKKILQEKIGIDTNIIVWPYGQYNQSCLEEAKKNGFNISMSLDDRLANVSDVNLIPRVVIVENPSIAEFIKLEKRNFSDIPVKQRILQADLDMIYDADPVQQEKNLDEFVERVFNLKVTTVYLQAFCDDKGDGNISSVYFPNRVLPVKANLFSRVSNQLSVRGISVYAWMPMLSIVLPDKELNNSLRVKEFKNGVTTNSSSWYARLSPFNSVSRDKLKQLYEDLAINSKIDGIVFQDDGYLNDFEDFNDAALIEYKKITRGKFIPYQKLNTQDKNKWVEVKTDAMISLTNDFKKAVLRYRPKAAFARTLYAPILLDKTSREWFAQDYKKSLDNYDFVVIMAYPEMEKIKRPEAWLGNIVKEVAKYSNGINKTVFKIQAYDWDKKKWIDTNVLLNRLKILVAAGAKHVGYYPDNYVENHPDAEVIKLIMSVENFPFKRKYSVKDFKKEY